MADYHQRGRAKPVYVSNKKDIAVTNESDDLSIVTIGKYLKNLL